MADFVADLIAEPEAVSRLTEQAAKFLAANGVDAHATHHVALVLDELLVNVSSHSATGKAPASVRLTVRPDRVDAQVSDCGAKFDPRCPPNIDVTATVEDRPIGGLGLFLVQRVTDGLEYERVDERNQTTFWIRRKSAG